MKGSTAGTSRDGRTKQQPSAGSRDQSSRASGLDEGQDRIRLASPRKDSRPSIPFTSPSTTSLQSSSTAGPRSRIHRTLSRPKWLDVDANGGLLKRKTEPALATVTVKGADSIIRRDELNLPWRGEDGKGKGKEKPQMRKALTMDTVSSPRTRALPSPRRRVSQSPLYTSCGPTTADDPVFARSPEQDEPRGLMDVASETRKGLPAESRDAPGTPLKADDVHIGRANEHTKPDALEDATSLPAATSSEDPDRSHPENVMTGDSQPPQDSRLWTWGKWAYTYVPAIRRSASEASPAVETETTDPGISSETVALPDLERLEETAINEEIGTIPSSDVKEAIYNAAFADEAPGTETEQGIGVDPEHRSEVPFFTDNRTIADNKATWSLTGLAAGAWNWRKGAETVSAAAPSREDAPIPTGLDAKVDPETNAGGEPTSAQEDLPVRVPQDSEAADGPAISTESSTLGNSNDGNSRLQADDVPTLSRSAWAFAAASRLIARRSSGADSAGIQVRATGAASLELPSAMDEATTHHNSQDRTSVNTAAADLPHTPTTTIPSAAAQAIKLTPEVLEARPSPLLPSSASMAATTRPNLVLPSFNHTFRRPPRCHPEQSRPKGSVANFEDKNARADMPSPDAPLRPVSPPSMAWRALGAVSQYARGGSRDSSLPPKSNNMDVRPVMDVEKSPLPIVTSSGKDQWKGVRRIVIIGVHGWFPNAHVQKVIGAPRGSSYFASMMGQAVLAQFEADFGVGQEAPEKVTYIPLDGEGTVDVRVEKLFKAYLSLPDWMRDVRQADAIFVAAHSQGTVVATHLLARFVNQGHIRTPYNAEAVDRCEYAFGPVAQTGSPSRGKSPITSRSTYPKVGLLAMCGVHQGPFYSSTTSTVLQPYLTWFENAAARELFEFQDSHSAVVGDYKKALDTILHHGVKTIFLASLDDQMVPIYSATFAAASHPLILRLLYVDAAIHSSTDFMINLIVFCLMLRNAGLDDQGLIGHLSEATAGAWRGAGHSTPYEDPGAYAFMVKYLLSTDCPADAKLPDLKVEDFAVRDAKNDYELPWILRGVMDDPDVKTLFDAEITELKENILSWNPTTRALRDMKKRLEPMAGRAALRQHQQKERLHRSSSFLSLASSDGQASARRQDELSSSPLSEGMQKKGLKVAVPTVMNADW